MQFDLHCPVENRGVTVKNNSKTGEPYALFKLFNLSDSVISALSFTVHAYDGNGGALGDISVNLTELSAEPKSFFAENKAVSLTDFPETKHVTVAFHEVQFEEGESYTPTGEPVEITIPEPDYEEKIRLTAAAGEDALCYAQDAGTHWICVCGRPNLPEAEICVRCGRDMKTVMAQFSSKDTLSKTLADQIVAEKIAAEEAEAEKAQRKLEKRKKAGKISLITLIGLAVLAFLIFIGSLIFDGVSILLGNSAAKKGDALSAYKFYAQADSAKVSSVSDAVLGNSNSNLFAGGYMTDDEENLYFVNPMGNIQKRAKNGTELTKLADGPGLFLNVSDGWLYYLDYTTGQNILRVSTDGTTSETVYTTDEESYLGTLALAGNELFFTVQEPAKNVTPEMQEQMAAQGQSGPIYQYRLYRLKIGSHRAVPVSDKSISQVSIYKGRLYFIDSDDGALYSMSRNGKDIKKLVSGPVYGADFCDDALYYLDGTVNETTGQPKLSLEKASYEDGSHLETVIADAMVVNYGFDGTDLYYMAYDGTAVSLYKKSAGGEAEFLLEGCQAANFCDGYLFYVGMDGAFMLSNPDKTGYDAVSLPSAEATEVPTETEGEVSE